MTDPYIKGWNKALEAVRGVIMFVSDNEPTGDLQEIVDYIDGARMSEEVSE